MSHLVELAPLKGPVVVTAAYFCLWYYLLLGLQRGVKYKLRDEYAARGEAFDRYFGQDPRMLAVDRVVINTQEQMVPFLVSMWMHALLVSPTHATVLGLAYVALRGLYPALLGTRVSKLQSRRVVVATIPCYLIVVYLLGSTVFAALAG
ncbi:MAG: MAPEG family protein [Myxococcota bacterium]